NVKTKRGKISVIKQYLIDYTANSNLHGLKYIGERERTSVEKIFWLFMFTCCVILCAALIRKVWIKWNESPVIVSFAENSTPVWQIPYPAVTICFETKARQTKFNFTYFYHLNQNQSTSGNFTEEERNLFEDVSLVCDTHLAPADGRKYSLGNETIENIKELSPNISDVLIACKWKDVPKNSCSDLFIPILTEEGLCYTFNTMAADELFRIDNLNTDYEYLERSNKTQTWSLENGYPPNTPLETYPHRGTGYGATAGLVILLRAKKQDFDYLCRGPVQGFKILLHNPAELPRLSQQYFRSPLSQEVVVAVKPKMMTTSDGLKPYDPIGRQCYFPSERYLKYYKVYTQANCDMECLTNFTNARCGCVHFGMPHGPEMRVCNAGSVACMNNAEMELVTVEIQSRLDEEMSSNDTLGEARRVAAECKCLPACTSIEYEAETSQADFDFKALFKAYNFPLDDDDKDLVFARVMIFFKEAQFITSRRSELYGQTDFLANCGGLLGLFMGFSILSVAEIIYFLTLRVICLLWKRRQAKKRKFFKENAESLTNKPEKLKDLTKGKGSVQDKRIKKYTKPPAMANVKNKEEKNSLIIQYLQDTHLHCLKYIGEKDRTMVEKIFWLLMITLSVLFCAGLIHKVWLKWNNSPVIVSFAETATPVWQIPYPAVTLCPEIKVMQTVFNYTEYYYLRERNTISPEEEKIFEDITVVCNKDATSWISGRNFSFENETVENIKKVSPQIGDVIIGTMFKNKIISDLTLFSPILTEEGLCYTFNIIGADELLRIDNLNSDYHYYGSSNKSLTWTLENGYPPNTPLETYPHRGIGSAENGGLTLLLKAAKKFFDYLCSGATQGFKVVLHNPAEFPRLSQQYIRIPLGQDVVVAVKPKMMTTSEGLKPYNPIRRQCYFPSERYLRFFKVYTQTNCETECFTNFTYVRCGCVHFGLPLELATVEIESYLEEGTNADDVLEEARLVAKKCICLPACTSLEYEAETSQSDFDIVMFLKALHFLSKEEQDAYYTQTKIFFKERQFIKVQRSELYGYTDFLANCGGLLGVFLGFSILSIVEIIYFLTLRL
ncbi:uncharacterized protein LOC123660657, partial [Melitaea cinxia]|uniref:uncharacterized protein LOC123660657 n=1 Tax=Melitaea cinxia TaxID=113334 RepID=UPI001E27049D